MKKNARVVLLLTGLMGICLITAVTALLPSFSQGSQKEKLESFFQKKAVTIAVTDSGLGGLSIMAKAAKRMKEAGIFQKVNFIFFNALFSSEGGYNSLKTRDERILIFDSALQSLEKNCRPDLILIGCNTLSVICAETRFSKKTKIPVVGIIEAGVELIGQNLHNNPNSAAIIFATPTTIREGTHKRLLLEQGFAANRIIEEPCAELETYIENGYNSEETGMLIAGFVDEALQKIPSPRPPILVSLNCTHYGYSLPLWENAFETSGIKPLAILNPNSRMIDFLFRQDCLKRFLRTEVTARVVSMVEISKEKINSLGEWLRKISPETAEALFRYELKPGLFEWKKFIK